MHQSSDSFGALLCYFIARHAYFFETKNPVILAMDWPESMAREVKAPIYCFSCVCTFGQVSNSLSTSS